MNQIEVLRKQIQAVVCMIGAVTWLILGRMIGYNGIAYLAAAAEGFALMMCILSDRLPDVLGRMLRSRNTKGQYKNAARIRSSVMIFQSIAGILGSVILFFIAAPLTEKVFQIPYGMLALKILAPAVTFRVITGIFLGFFQGSGTQMPTLVVSVLRQIFYLVFGILFINLFKEYGENVKLLLLNDSLVSMYGAAGMAVAVVLAELLVLIFTVLVYLGSGKSRKPKEEGLKKTETFLSSVGGMYSSLCPLILTGVFFRLPVWLGMFLYQRSVEDIYASAWTYGEYYGGYLVLCAIPILLGNCIVHPMAARVAGASRKGDQHYGRMLLGTGFHLAMVVTLFFAVFMTVMATHISCTLAVSGEQSQVVADMLKKGSAIVLLTVLLAYFGRVLLYMGKQYLLVAAAGIYAIVYIVGMIVGIRMLALGIDGLIYAGLAASGIVCLLVGFYLFKMLRVKWEYLSWLGIPAVGALVSGLLCFLLSKYATPHLGFLFTMILGFVVGLMVYLMIIVLLRSFRRQELEVMPGGWIIKSMNQLFHKE